MLHYKNPPEYAECIGRIMNAADRRGMVARSKEQADKLGANGLTFHFGDPALVADESLLESLYNAAYTVCSVDPCNSVGVQVAASIEATHRPNYLFVLTKPEHHGIWARRILTLTGRPGMHLVSTHMNKAAAQDLSVTLALCTRKAEGVH
jgi:hypothetical protein